MCPPQLAELDPIGRGRPVVLPTTGVLDSTRDLSLLEAPEVECGNPLFCGGVMPGLGHEQTNRQWQFRVCLCSLDRLQSAATLLPRSCRNNEPFRLHITVAFHRGDRQSASD